MRPALAGIIALPELHNAEDRAALWRQCMAALAQAARDLRPLPLEGLPPERVLAAVRVTLESGLIDDAEWLSRPAYAAALYALATATPSGPEKRLLGRRVLTQLYEGEAATFTTLATALAMESKRLLMSRGVRARIALAIEMPIGVSTQADRLALTLLSKESLCRPWLIDPSAGSLPARRLAARLLERAAREAARRAQLGDAGGLRVFQRQAVHTAWLRLLQDRESLVWRHVATARGLLSKCCPEFAAEIERQLLPNLTPFEWRRGAVSLAASVAVDPFPSLSRCRTLLSGEIIRQDPGTAATMMHGLARAAEIEPQASAALLERIVDVGGLEAAEALAELAREGLGIGFAATARARAIELLAAGLAPTSMADDGRTALRTVLLQNLATEPSHVTLQNQVDAAVSSYAEHGADHARKLALQVFVRAQEAVADLERSDMDTTAGRQRAFALLHELDLALLETGALGHLLALDARDRKPHDDVPHGARLSELFKRIGAWVMQQELQPIAQSGAVPHLTLRLRRLRSLLHLVDAEGLDAHGLDAHGLDARSALALNHKRYPRAHRLQVATLLLTRMRSDAPSPLRRVLCAALARACDALVRDELVELSDVLVAIADHAHSSHDLVTLTEASMLPEIVAALRGYTHLHDLAGRPMLNGPQTRLCLDALRALAQELPWASTPRVSALRGVLLQVVRDLETLSAARSLRALVGHTDVPPVHRLERSLDELAQLTLGARRRLGGEAAREAADTGPALRSLGLALEQLVQARDQDQPVTEVKAQVDRLLDTTSRTLHTELPAAIASVIDVVLERIRALAGTTQDLPTSSLVPPAPQEMPLPAWLPPNRIVGGFYVLRPVAAGGVGSVFVVKRLEERHDERARRFALKVPDYNAAAARSVSEREFLRMFREEASALLAIPHHRNLAAFVTFDAGAHPKPILVMELVEGPTLERIIERGDLSLRQAWVLLDGIAAGLSAMHDAGVGHLDVKPSNVIVRPSEARSSNSLPVLVDFGLSGRQLRPGCATGNYGAPEVWGLVPGDCRPTPQAADTYAFACLCFEVLTGRTLFEGAHEIALIHEHLQHDGVPEALSTLRRDPQLAPLCALIASGLRRHPDQRIGMPQLREGLRAIAPELRGLRWPLGQLDRLPLDVALHRKAAS